MLCHCNHWGCLGRVFSRLTHFGCFRLHHWRLEPRRAAPSYGITVMSGYDMPVVGVTTSIRVASRSICAAITVHTSLVAGHPVTVADISCVPASCCPLVNAVAAADGAYPADVVAPINRRRTKAMRFFGASTKGSLNLRALQGIQT